MKKVLKWFLLLVLLGILVYGGIMAWICIRENAANTAELPVSETEAIIVLGAQVKPDGTPSVQLAWRLDTAYECWLEHAVPIAVCGARGRDEPATEASVMQAYLMAKGVPEESILTDDSSVNTEQNLANAAALLAPLGVRKVLIVTSDYHLPRALAMAEDMQLEASGRGSPCKSEYWLKNHAREVLAWCKYWAIRYLGIPL